MVGIPEVAAKAVHDAFLSLASGNDTWPEWYSALEAVHRWCTDYVRSATERGERLPSPEPPQVAATGAVSGEDEPPIASETVRSVYSSLSEEDRSILWRALMGTAVESEWERLAAALDRLDVALRNEDIPGGGEFEWPS